jgi:hypothetical protein
VEKKIQPPVCVRGLCVDDFAFTFYILCGFWNAVSTTETALSRILMTSDDDDDDDGDDGWVLKIWEISLFESTVEWTCKTKFKLIQIPN